MFQVFYTLLLVITYVLQRDLSDKIFYSDKRMYNYYLFITHYPPFKQSYMFYVRFYD
jgi:hypothetical protein